MKQSPLISTLLPYTTLFRSLPYNQPVYGAGNEPTIVDVEALQFGWDFSKTEFKVGEPIEFHVTARDVNHGFGIYNEDLERSEEHTSELQSRGHLVCRLLLEK